MRLPSRSLSFLLLALFVSAGPAGAGQEDPGWERVSDDDNIRIYKKEIAGSAILALKAKSVLNASLEKVAAVIDQVEKQPQWVPYLAEARQLIAASFYDRLIYTVSNAPWPAQDRDFLIRSHLIVDRKRKKITVELRSVEGPEMPVRKDRVRGAMAFSRLILEPRNHGSKTFFCMELQVDPKGWIPTWIVNLIQRRWARKYVMGLRKQAARPDIRVNPRIREFLGE